MCFGVSFLSASGADGKRIDLFHNRISILIGSVKEGYFIFKDNGRNGHAEHIKKRRRRSRKDSIRQEKIPERQHPSGEDPGKTASVRKRSRKDRIHPEKIRMNFRECQRRPMLSSCSWMTSTPRAQSSGVFPPVTTSFPELKMRITTLGSSTL